MAFLLTIIGLIVTTLLPRIITGTKRDLMAEHKRAVRSARHEILGYAKANNCNLPPVAWFAATAPHRLGRRGTQIVYTPNTTVTLPSGTVISVAFRLASNGTDGQADNAVNYTDPAATVWLGNLTDDAVDFVTQGYLSSLCP